VYAYDCPFRSFGYVVTHYRPTLSFPSFARVRVVLLDGTLLLAFHYSFVHSLRSFAHVDATTLPFPSLILVQEWETRLHFIFQRMNSYVTRLLRWSPIAHYQVLMLPV
jgi:hypothetical protein